MAGGDEKKKRGRKKKKVESDFDSDSDASISEGTLSIFFLLYKCNKIST